MYGDIDIVGFYLGLCRWARAYCVAHMSILKEEVVYRVHYFTVSCSSWMLRRAACRGEFLGACGAVGRCVFFAFSKRIDVVGNDV